MSSANSIRKMYENTAFYCPHCHAYSQQKWGRMDIISSFRDGTMKLEYKEPSYFASVCGHCGKASIWLDYNEIIYPSTNSIPFPSFDMPAEIKDDYLEAREICGKSPRSAAALLRLSIQKLMPLLGEKGKNINEDIASLVKKGLPEMLQQALDSVRVIGNYAVHPGELDVKDDLETAKVLFNIVNLIIDNMITKPKQVQQLFNSLPKKDLNNINKRDNGDH